MGRYAKVSPSLARFRPRFSSVERGSSGSFATQTARNLSYTASRARDSPGQDGLLAKIYGITSEPQARIRTTADPGPPLFQNWRCGTPVRCGVVRSSFLGVAVSATQAQQERNRPAALSPPRRGTGAWTSSAWSMPKATLCPVRVRFLSRSSAAPANVLAAMLMPRPPCRRLPAQTNRSMQGPLSSAMLALSCAKSSTC